MSQVRPAAYFSDAHVWAAADTWKLHMFYGIIWATAILFAATSPVQSNTAVKHILVIRCRSRGHAASARML